MPRKLPPFCYREKSRHGKIRYYFRKDKGPRIRLPDYGTDDFFPAYSRAAGQVKVTRQNRGIDGSLEWLLSCYKNSSAYLSLSPATRRQRDNIFVGVIGTAGNSDYKAITRSVIVKGREKRAATPAQARNFLDAMRGLFRWALEVELITADPTAGVKNLRRPKGSGFAAWTESEVVAYCSKWPTGTRERVWLEVLLHTGLRRGDAVKIGRQHISDGLLTLATEKTGMVVNIPLQGDFLEALEQGPTGDLALIVGDRGLPLTKESFGNMFRKACVAAGIDKSAHGLRKLAATRIAEAGASVAELEAIFGWSGGAMASLYTKTVDRKRLARSGMEKMQNAKTPHPSEISPHPRKNTN